MNAVLQENTQDAELKLKKSHIRLMRHPETCLFAGVILMGESSVRRGIPTAYTDGVNKRYGYDFVMKLDMPELNGLVLHENGHVMLKHIPRHKDLMKKNQRLANVAMDFVINDIIMEISKKDPSHVKLPQGALYHPMFHDWSVREVWDYLNNMQQPNGGAGKGQPQNGNQNGQSQGGMPDIDDMNPLDEHDESMMEEVSDEEAQEISDRIDEAINEGSVIAGRFGAKIPRAIQEVTKPRIDWREELREFVSAATHGRTDFTWRSLNRRRLIDDLYIPSMHSETIEEGIICNDTSGSIGQDMLNMVGGEIVSICDTCKPERMRVLWWDTQVHGEQVFEGDFSGIASALKPVGGGGTELSCVADYVRKNNMNPAFIIVFTDGYVEDNPDVDYGCPVLWLLPPSHNKDFNPVVGKKVIVEV